MSRNRGEGFAKHFPLTIGQLEGGQNVKFCYEGRNNPKRFTLQVDFDGELNGEDVFDMNGSLIPDSLPKNPERVIADDEIFWRSVRQIDASGTTIGL